ncbi:hypothetical protein LXL04_034612 [Taraxacum kok-saghyz]
MKQRDDIVAKLDAHLSAIDEKKSIERRQLELKPLDDKDAEMFEAAKKQIAFLDLEVFEELIRLIRVIRLVLISPNLTSTADCTSVSHAAYIL